MRVEECFAVEGAFAAALSANEDHGFHGLVTFPLKPSRTVEASATWEDAARVAWLWPPARK